MDHGNLAERWGCRWHRRALDVLALVRRREQVFLAHLAF